MKRALLMAAIDPSLGGVLVLGDRGTGKSTAVRALAQLLPLMKVVEGCRYGCDPAAGPALCEDCKARGKLRTAARPVPVVDLPLGATEDRVVGALDLEKALTRGEKSFEPGLLAQAHRGFLYVDEVNCWRIIWSIFCWMWRPPARTWSSAMASRCDIRRALC